jgi:acetylornithine deacetylase/succinyl-diaminopimelate desuccinylase-like protein
MRFPASLPALLSDLVAIPSVTPGYDSGGTPPGERALGDYVTALLEELGAEVSRQEVAPGRSNVIGRFIRRAHAPTIALVPHLDTVGTKGMTVAPFTPEIRDGRLYGRGACDTKGPMAAALWAVKAWCQTAAPDHNVVFAATVGEEELSVGASALATAGFRADFAVALEPTDLRVVHAAKGVIRLWVEARGRAAHAATPEAGDNAIYRTLPFLRSCAETLAPAFAARTHAILGPASLNVGLVDGGAGLNVVPAFCRVGLDLRTHPDFDNAAALTAVQRAAPGLEVTVHRNGPSFALQTDHPWIQKLARHATGVTHVPWFSDANIFNAHGIPAVAFGPGSIAQAHTADEFIALEALSEGSRALAAFLTTA